MRIPFIPGLLMLHLLLLCDRSAAQSHDLESASTESETRDVHRDEKPNREVTFDKSAANSRTNSSQADFPCPDAAAIAPCVCTVDGEQINLDCTFVKSQDELASVFQQEFPVKALHEFSMANNSAITVLGNIFNEVTFESIHLSPGPFALELVSDYFILENKNTLSSINIRFSQITSDSFPFVILSQMEILDYIRIDTSSLTWIPAIAAPSLSNLEFRSGLTDSIAAGTFPIHEWYSEFDLPFNKIVTVEPGSFFFTDENSAASSGSLTIFLYGNQLQSLQAGTFPLRNGDVYLSLASNQIALIEPGTFVLPEATDSLSLTLDLDHNQLTTVDEAVFGELMAFTTELRVNDNPLSCGCDIAWLVLNSDYMAKVGNTATCSSGTNLINLDPSFFAEFC